jgi:uncharacterized protein (TIGR00375 family)
MKVIADLHIHSKYAYACSKDLTLQNLSDWAQKKGINVLSTGDFTHPRWLSELEANLEEVSPGLFKLKGKKNLTRFILGTEIASIFKHGEKTRRVHNLIFSPSIPAVKRLIANLRKLNANLASDGRPITGISGETLLTICKEADEGTELIPAHVWTPHFGAFGSLSGFDSLTEAYGKMAGYIFAVETGLSSNPMMNWQVSQLDSIALISNSDAHSLRKLGREANVFEIEHSRMSYGEIMRVIKGRKPDEFLYTIEFFPEEGKYHMDGHRTCGFSSTPEETKKLKGICPVCGKKLLRGVMHRVDELGDRKIGFTPKKHVPYRSIIPLEEIIAESFGMGVASKKVADQYEKMVASQPEFALLLDADRELIAKLGSPEIAESVMRVRKGKVHIDPGYDGVFGKIEIYNEVERGKLLLRPGINPEA